MLPSRKAGRRLYSTQSGTRKRKKKKKDFATFAVSKKNVVINSKKVNNNFPNNSDLIQDFVTFTVPKKRNQYYLEDSVCEQVRAGRTAFAAEISSPLRCRRVEISIILKIMQMDR